MPSICDGTKRRGTRDCDESARWLVRVAGDEGWVYAACDRHLAQVGRYLLEGEHGELDVQGIWVDES
ncbi:hypothetical protein [Streptomyces sp. 5-6(2022)]|uniref:hypothetical protein n=1 Tax=Streptomyces sp. 5-6(2022) TaxID=2936510 RepID=UPI0023B9AD92|nr:hypothetical protein [Streptomyces sp. 5-6(2022)]